MAAASVSMGGGAADAESAVAPASESDWHERFASVLKAKGMKAAMKEIGSSIFCVHGQKRTFCKECGGGGLCEHGRRRSNCKSCGFCEHGLRRRRCKECGGAGISKHGQQRHPPPPHPKHGQQRHPPPPPPPDLASLAAEMYDELVRPDVEVDSLGAQERVASTTAATTADVEDTAVASRANEKLQKEMSCPICLDWLSDPHMLPCQHAFCGECIDQHLRSHREGFCPTCRAPTVRRAPRRSPQLAAMVELVRAHPSMNARERPRSSSFCLDRRLSSSGPIRG